MTLDEMQIAVYKTIPAEVKKKRDWFYGELKWEDEGLQVCHEAEKILNSEEKEQYSYLLENATFTANHHDYCLLHATYEQRLEALCRVWFPERFK